MSKYDHYFETNKEVWNAKTDVHIASDFYDMESFLNGATSLDDIVTTEIGQIEGKSILHLQCHFGQDSLSMARMGAKVCGLDLSDLAIQRAKELNQQLGLDARFVNANVYDTRKVLSDETFDMVYTSYGTICWLPDLDLWAKVVADSLKDGGTFYMADFHPTLLMWDFGSNTIRYHHNNINQPYEEVEEGTYGDRNAKINKKEYFWNHSSQEVINALIDQGLRLQFFNEHYHSPYNCFDNMKEISPGKYVYGSQEYPLPHVFSMKWTK